MYQSKMVENIFVNRRKQIGAHDIGLNYAINKIRICIRHIQYTVYKFINMNKHLCPEQDSLACFNCLLVPTMATYSGRYLAAYIALACGRLGFLHAL